MVLPSQKSWGLTALVLGLVVPLAACSNSSFSQQLERSLAADPRLTSPSAAESPAAATVNLPADFPNEIPLYPGATLRAVLPYSMQAIATPTASGPTARSVTRWQTTDSPEQVHQWYQQRFEAEGWQLLQSTPDVSATAPIVAQRNDLRVTVTVQPPPVQPDAGVPANSPAATPSPTSPMLQLGAGTPQTPSAALPATPTAVTEFSLDYLRLPDQAAVGIASPAAGTLPTPAATPPRLGRVPQPGEPEFIGPVPPANFGTQPSTPPSPVTTATPTQPNLADLPPQLQAYITDLQTLGVLKSANGSSDFQPNEPISRRKFARWLVSANNLMNVNRPANQIRLAPPSSQPVFSDVPASDPDFGAIQGLAEAGVISSRLSGDTAATTFRPDAPLTREALVLWKVPLDIRRSLPNGSVDLVQQTWGFQDAPQINPKVLRALVADHQNGEQSNIRRAFGFTTLFQPNKPVTQAEAAAALWFFGSPADGMSAQDALRTNQPAAQP